MAEENNQNNERKKKNPISTGNPVLDIAITAVTVVAGATVGEVAHRVSESRSRKKALKLAMEENNKKTEKNKRKKK